MNPAWGGGTAAASGSAASQVSLLCRVQAPEQQAALSCGFVMANLAVKVTTSGIN